MVQINWEAVGERYYDTGLSHGVLYVDGSYGVPWNGLASVTEAPSGGVPTTYFLDGVPYNSASSVEEFSGTIEAFSSPEEFDECEGMVHVGNGLYDTNRYRKAFGFCYRTLVGNDVDGSDHSYKIHLIYNALASTSKKRVGTLSDQMSLSPLSWDITTKPTDVPSASPSAHIIIDATVTRQSVLASIEDRLYGGDNVYPYLPSPSELYELFLHDPVLTIFDNGDGSFTVTGPDEIVEQLDVDTFRITSDAVTYEDSDTYVLHYP